MHKSMPAAAARHAGMRMRVASEVAAVEVRLATSFARGDASATLCEPWELVPLCVAEDSLLADTLEDGSGISSSSV